MVECSLSPLKTRHCKSCVWSFQQYSSILSYLLWKLEVHQDCVCSCELFCANYPWHFLLLFSRFSRCFSSSSVLLISWTVLKLVAFIGRSVDGPSNWFSWGLERTAEPSSIDSPDTDWKFSRSLIIQKVTGLFDHPMNLAEFCTLRQIIVTVTH